MNSKLKLDLGGTWKLESSCGTYRFDAAVPGSFFFELEKSGYWEGGSVFWRENNRRCDALADRDVTYSRSFSLDEAFVAHNRKCFLLCEGLDTLAEIKVNGKKVLDADNMHRTWLSDISRRLQPGSNTISVLLKNTIAAAERLDRKRHIWSTNETVPGANQIRKNFCSYGWDWGPSIPDMGIWRPVSVISCKSARISDLRIRQKHANGKVVLALNTEIDSWETGSYSFDYSVSGPGDDPDAVVMKDCKRACSMEIGSPGLWWPNNLGGQPLYSVEVVLKKDGAEIDRVRKRIGLRTLELDRKKDRLGESFGFRVNGIGIFACGANIIPQDVYLTRADKAATGKMLESCAAANFNCVRVWGGGIYPDDDFYDLCDELGLIVWQDLMFACALYPGEDEKFLENISAEINDNLGRIRHHASLGLVCGNNEMEWSFTDWDNMVWDEKSRAEYTRQYEFLLPKLAAEQCPDTAYWKASPSSGGFFDNPNDDGRGDVHFWKIWHGGAPFTEFRKRLFRFLSEYGFQSFPSLKTIRSFCAERDLNPYSPVMEDHQRNGDGAGNQKIMKYAGDYFRLGRTLADNVYISQVSQAEAGRYAVEHLRQNRQFCKGSTYWQLNDIWPVSSWSSIDYFGRWKALHYAMKRAYSPVLLSCREEGTTAEIHLSNESREKVKGTIAWKLCEFSGKVLAEGKMKAEAGPFSSVTAGSPDLKKTLTGSERSCCLSVFFDGGSGRNAEQYARKICVVFERYKKLDLPDPELSWEFPPAGSDEAQRTRVRITAKRFAKFVFLDFPDADPIFSDNYFDMEAGGERIISVGRNLSKKELSTLQVRSLFDTY